MKLTGGDCYWEVFFACSTCSTVTRYSNTSVRCMTTPYSFANTLLFMKHSSEFLIGY